MLGQPGCIALVTFFSLREEQKTGCIDTKSFSFTSSEAGMPKHALSEIWDEILVEAWERMTPLRSNREGNPKAKKSRVEPGTRPIR